VIFGFDIDGVLYPWHIIAWKWWKERTGNSTTSFHEFWKYPGGWVAENEGTQLVLDMVAHKPNYTSAPISPYVHQAVWDIAENYADKIYYITGRPTHIKDATRQYLLDNKMPQAKNLYFSDENGGKLEIIKSLGCDYYVEDRPKYLEILPQITTVFAIICPYNMYREWDAITIHHVMEIPRILDSIEEIHQ